MPPGHSPAALVLLDAGAAAGRRHLRVSTFCSPHGVAAQRHSGAVQAAINSPSARPQARPPPRSWPCPILPEPFRLLASALADSGE
jgi:hypothetical protein